MLTLVLSLMTQSLPAAPESIALRGHWTDVRTRLTWAASDNGSGVTASQARRYCRTLRSGEFADWRLPTLSELKTLFGGAPNSRGLRLIAPLKLTGWAWSMDPGEDEGEMWALDFADGASASVVTGDAGLNRALCVRRE